MKKIVIAPIDLQALNKNDLTKKYANYIIENCKNGKYDYRGKETDKIYYYCEVSDKFLKELKELFDKVTIDDVSIMFIVQITKKLKAKEKEEKEDSSDEFDLF